MALYAALIYQPASEYWTDQPQQQERPSSGYAEFMAQASAAGVIRGGEALFPPEMATTITVAGGQGGDVIVTDGPYAEAKGGPGRLLPYRGRRPGRGNPVGEQDPGDVGRRQGRAAPRGRPAEVAITEVAGRDPGDQLAETIRVAGAAVLATLTRTFGNMQLAEDAVQEAAVAALKAWPQSGIPASPSGWLLVTARNKAYDILRRESARPAKESVASYSDRDPMPDTAEEAIALLESAGAIRDDMLRLIFTCCHPALAPEARVALALRTLAGLDVQAIARAFGVPEQTMAKRLVRARQKIATARIPYKIPDDAELPERLPAVLSVISVIATEAHSPSSGDAVTRIDYEQEAIRLARLLAELMPGEPEILGLLALLLFTAARRPARTSPPRTGAEAGASGGAGGAGGTGGAGDGAGGAGGTGGAGGGEPVLLRDQDRSAWDHAMIAEAGALLAEAFRRSAGVAGPFSCKRTCRPATARRRPGHGPTGTRLSACMT